MAGCCYSRPQHSDTQSGAVTMSKADSSIPDATGKPNKPNKPYPESFATRGNVSSPIDWDAPERNVFHVVDQLPIHGQNGVAGQEAGEGRGAGRPRPGGRQRRDGRVVDDFEAAGIEKGDPSILDDGCL